MVDVPLLDAYFTVLLMVFGGGVGIMLKVRSQDINRIERKIDNVIEQLNMSTNIQTQYLAEINASLKTMIEFMKNKK
jgi:hypothetical protein